MELLDYKMRVSTTLHHVSNAGQFTLVSCEHGDLLPDTPSKESLAQLLAGLKGDNFQLGCLKDCLRCTELSHHSHIVRKDSSQPVTY